MKGFRPLFWGFVFNENEYDDDGEFVSGVFVPSSGDLFLMGLRQDEVLKNDAKRVFVPSSGDLFLISIVRFFMARDARKCFRPLFWGFVFNDIVGILEYEGWLDGFRPLFWGFVFNMHAVIDSLIQFELVFVPSSGDLFLIIINYMFFHFCFLLVFVPSSGDLFLIRSRGLKNVSISLTCFRPLFWGFVFNCRDVNEDWPMTWDGFRPLFWGFVFNLKAIETVIFSVLAPFSSPLLGICF